MQITNGNLFDYEEYIGKDLFKENEPPWEILPKIGEFVTSLGMNIGTSKFYCREGEDGKCNVWIARFTKIHKSAKLIGPLIIDSGTEVRPGAFIRGNVIIGKNCVIGNSTEIKNSVIMDNVQLPHYNYVGDSIIGNYSHLGAGAIISNLKSMKTEVVIDGEFPTGLRKVGAFIADNVEVGCNSVLNPGTVIFEGSIIYPLTCVRGIIPENSIVKTEIKITKRSKE